LDNDRQLGLYQIAVKEKFMDAKEISLIWHYLIFDKEFTSKRSDAQIAEAGAVTDLTLIRRKFYE